MSIKAVFFDLDGTLTGRSLRTPEVFRELLRQKGFQVSVEEIEKACLEVEREQQDVFSEQRGKISHSELYDIWEFHFLRALGIEDRNRELSRKINLHWTDVGEIKLYPDVIPTLINLRHKGVNTGIISDAYEKETQKILGIVNLDKELFDVIVGPDTVAKAKPNPEVFMYAAKMLKIKPEEAIFVGNDLERDYKAAEKAGMNPLLIVRSGNTEMFKNVQCITSLTFLIDSSYFQDTLGNKDNK